MNIYDTLINKGERYYDTVMIDGNKKQLHLFDKWLNLLYISIDDTQLDSGEKITSRSIIITNQPSVYQMGAQVNDVPKIFDFTLMRFGADSEDSDTIQINADDLKEIQELVTKHEIDHDIN